MILAAMAEVGVGADRTVMVGDTTFDVEMAVAAGVGALGVAWGYHPPGSLREAGAHGVIETCDSLGCRHRRLLCAPGAGGVTAGDEKPLKIPGKEPSAPPLGKRLYKTVSVEKGEGGFAILLDGRPVRTPEKLPLVVPTLRARRCDRGGMGRPRRAHRSGHHAPVEARHHRARRRGPET